MQDESGPSQCVYRSDDGIHAITLSVLCTLIMAAIPAVEGNFKASLVALALFGGACLLVAIPLLMHHRQHVVVLDVETKRCTAIERKLILPNNTVTFESWDIAAIGAMEVYGDGGPFFRPVVKLKSGLVLGIGRTNNNVEAAHVIAKAFAEKLGVSYDAILIPDCS